MPAQQAVSSHCEDDWEEHELCSHRWGFGGGPLFGPERFVPYVELCRCACHDACPLAGTERLPEAEWIARCECPAAAEEKVEAAARREQHRDASERKRSAFHEALEESDGADDADLEGLVRAAYERHGLEADDHQMELLAGVLKTKRMSAAAQPLHVIRLFGKALAPLVRVVGESIRDERRRRREAPEEQHGP